MQDADNYDTLGFLNKIFYPGFKFFFSNYLSKGPN